MTKKDFELPKLYREFAQWWPLLSSPADYEEETTIYSKTIIEASREPPVTLLELGCGGGNNASFLKKYFTLTLVDLSSQMLAVSKSLNPECEHLPGDMRSLRLQRSFDAVFIHDAIMYLHSVTDLSKAIETAYIHCKPGGVVLLAPDHVAENFKPSTTHGGHDGDDRSLRYLDWRWDPEPDDNTYISDMVYVFQDAEGRVRVAKDRHILGLFKRKTWLEILGQTGFKPTALPCNLSGIEPGSCEMFLGIKT
ncbi:class I SAM-dependent methyltransferase [Candidatus Riflebacteria bacterium]